MYFQWGRRLEDWPNTAARLAGWMRETQQGVILYIMDGPCRLPWLNKLLARSEAALLINGFLSCFLPFYFTVYCRNCKRLREFEGKTLEVTVNSKEENSADFFLDFVQEFGLSTLNSSPNRKDFFFFRRTSSLFKYSSSRLLYSHLISFWDLC